MSLTDIGTAGRGALVSQASRIFPRAHARQDGGRARGRKNFMSGDYSTVFVSPDGVCGSPIKLQQPCDIVERYVTCAHKVRGERNDGSDVYSSTQEQIQAAIIESKGTLRYSALRPCQTKVVEHSQFCFTSTRNLLFQLLFLFVNRLSPRLSQPSQLFYRENTRFTQVGLTRKQSFNAA